MSESKKIGQEPAFACSDFEYSQYGMSKRFYAACAAMQGILSSHAHPEASSPACNDDHELIISASYRFADELLKQEDL